MSAPQPDPLPEPTPARTGKKFQFGLKALLLMVLMASLLLGAVVYGVKSMFQEQTRGQLTLLLARVEFAEMSVMQHWFVMRNTPFKHHVDREFGLPASIRFSFVRLNVVKGAEGPEIGPEVRQDATVLDLEVAGEPEDRTLMVLEVSGTQGPAFLAEVIQDLSKQGIRVLPKPTAPAR